MLNNYTNEIELLRIWYKRAKEVVIKAESMDSLNKAYIQPLHELRYCLDHFMRTFEYEQDGKDADIKKSIFSAIGHLQRSYSDSIEWMLVNVKEEYVMVLEKYTNEQIQLTFPEYYTEIRPEFEKITQVVDEYKINKSIEKTTEIEDLSESELKALQIVTDQFLLEEIADKLQNYLAILHSREVSLIEAKRRDRRVSIKDKIIIPIVTGIAGGILVLLFQVIFL